MDVLVAEAFSSGSTIAPSSELLGRRLGRVAAGGVLALGPVIVLAQTAIVHGLDRHPVLTTAPLIALLWIAAAAAFRVAGRFGRSNHARAFFDDDAFATASFVVPAIGLGVAGPLSMHALLGLPVWLIGVAIGDSQTIELFDGYVALALVGTAHVHLIFTILLVLAAQQAAIGEAPARVRLWPAVIASCVPGALILFPPLLVWITGFAISRLYLRRAARWFDADVAVSIRR